jgi:hypothetical protein
VAECRQTYHATKEANASAEKGRHSSDPEGISENEARMTKMKLMTRRLMTRAPATSTSSLQRFRCGDQPMHFFVKIGPDIVPRYDNVRLKPTHVLAGEDCPLSKNA